MSRPLFLLLLLALLSGCEREEQAREAERAAQTPQQSISEPVDATEAPPDLEIEVAPVNQAAEAEPPPVQIDIPEPEAPQPAARSRPAPPKQPEKPAEVELVEPVLDLRLPEELAEELKPAPSSESIRLLPPLFDTGEPSRSMQIGGRLISGEAEDESLIEGAEIQFELKR
ncbi:hypothetical protein [Stutzerimonas frequens]|uniref:hypothetical protein n=1 Tax=Stutzerimonas frequens TaxID=2968969 RepID=UPI001D825AD9|nr:hypothetical protein [Stutzerimonas frequens]MBW8455930.1 hypothetical protein [Pseudomonas sp.]MDL0440089.1 hypothetical protein [Stutzerimonas frequens]